MVFLPIVERELRVASRRKSTHRIRLWTTAAGAAVCIFFFIWSAIFDGFMKNIGPYFFGTLTFYAYGLALLAGVFLAADCISEEKREGTLGLLFLTDLRGYDVVLGKLMAVGLSALYGLVAVLPVTALPLLLGGVTGAEYWRVALALVNALFFSLATGIFISTFSREAGRAMGNTLGVLVMATVVLPMLGKAFDLTGFPAAWYFTSISPFHAFRLGTAAGYFGFPERYWWSLLSSHLFGWLLLALACWRMPRAWQDRAIRQRTAPAKNEMGFSAAAVGSRRRRAPLLDENPILWLAAGDRGMRSRVWGVTALMLVLLGTMLAFDRSALTITGGSFVLMFLGFLLKGFFAFQATRFFVEARRSGALEMILSTPLGNREIIHGQWLALKRIFLWPVVIFATMQILVFVAALMNQSGLSSNVTTSLQVGIFGVGPGNLGSIALKLVQFAMVLYGVAKFLADMVAVGFVGMWLGLSAKKPGMAAGMTVLFVLIAPMMAFCVPSVVIDAFLILWARNNLFTEFRRSALHQTGFATVALPVQP